VEEERLSQSKFREQGHDEASLLILLWRMTRQLRVTSSAFIGQTPSSIIDFHK
jgi:hypothetical protein